MFVPGRWYRDAVGRRWRVLGRTGHTVLVRRAWTAGPMLGHIYEDEGGCRAEILLKDGFTTIYEEEGP